MYHVGQWIVRHKVGAVAVTALAVVVLGPNQGGSGLFSIAALSAPSPVAEAPAQQAVRPQVVEAPVDVPDQFYDEAGGDELVDDPMAGDPAADVQPDLVPEPEPVEPDLVAEPAANSVQA